jgi:uncharacterized RDD family membrane protein YckC
MKYKPLHPVIDDLPDLASFWRRGLAYIIDMLTIGILLFIAFQICNYLGLHVTSFKLTSVDDIEVTGQGMTEKEITYIKWGLISIPILYFSLSFYFTNGKSLGKWITRIRIVSLYHHKISFWHCIERTLGYAASTVELGLGFLQFFWNPNRMCLHDRIAETIVIQEHKKIKKKK